MGYRIPNNKQFSELNWQDFAEVAGGHARTEGSYVNENTVSLAHQHLNRDIKILQQNFIKKGYASSAITRSRELAVKCDEAVQLATELSSTSTEKFDDAEGGTSTP